jgi:hypothetical protein
LRPLHVIEEAAQLSNRIAGASPTIGQTVPPLATLLGRVQDAYGSFGLTDPADYSHNARACLQQQLRMVEWYANKGQIVHVLSLARQWLPSLLCYRFGLDPMEPANREDMELLLRGGTDKDSGRESRYLSEWASVPSGKRLRALWGGGLNLANLRNDVLHAGFLRHPKNAGTIVALTQEVVGELRAIAAQWQL